MDIAERARAPRCNLAARPLYLPTHTVNTPWGVVA